MDILPDSSDNLTVSEWDLITDILLNLDLGLPTNKALNLLSIPALRAFIAQSDQIVNRQRYLKRDALETLARLEN
jgi:hypothetical protein